MPVLNQYEIIFLSQTLVSDNMNIGRQEALVMSTIKGLWAELQNLPVNGENLVIWLKFPFQDK